MAHSLRDHQSQMRLRQSDHFSRLDKHACIVCDEAVDPTPLVKINQDLPIVHRLYEIGRMIRQAPDYQIRWPRKSHDKPGEVWSRTKWTVNVRY